MWRCYLMDTMTGLLGAPLDVPRLSWDLTVPDSSLSTTDDKGLGAMDATGLSLPWADVPATDAAGRNSALAPSRRSVCLMWDEGDGSAAVPVLVGAIGQRTDGERDTGFDLSSPMAMLDDRIAVREGAYGTSAGSTSTDAVSLSGMSLRAIVCELVRLCTSAKPGGTLPIDLPYLGEAGGHERTYSAYDVANLSCRRLIEAIANVSGGPDVQLRPYLADGLPRAGSGDLVRRGSPTSERASPRRGIVPHAHGGSRAADPSRALKVATHRCPRCASTGGGAGSDVATIGATSRRTCRLCSGRTPWARSSGPRQRGSDGLGLGLRGDSWCAAHTRTPSSRPPRPRRLRAAIRRAGATGVSLRGTGRCRGPGAIWPRVPDGRRRTYSGHPSRWPTGRTGCGSCEGTATSRGTVTLERFDPFPVFRPRGCDPSVTGRGKDDPQRI